MNRLRQLALASLLGTGLVAGCGDGEPTGREPASRPFQPPPGWTTYSDDRRGYEIYVPGGWQPAQRNIVPRLTDPQQVVAFGTYPLRHRPTPRCEAFAGAAREDLGPDDVLGVVMERGLDPSSKWSEFVPRPPRFGPTDPRGAEPGCGDRPGTTSDWIPFTDSGRHFYALLVFGAAVTDSRREQAYRTLDSLSLDPAVRPDWPSSG